MNANFAKGWRTVAFNVATFAVLLGAGLTGQIENPETLRWLAIGITVANVALRFLSTTAVGEKS